MRRSTRWTARWTRWAPTLDPAADRVRANLDALRQVLLRREAGKIRSAEDVVDAARADAARTPDPRRRADLLGAARLLRRIDQAVVGFSTDIGRRDVAAEPGAPSHGP